MSEAVRSVDAKLAARWTAAARPATGVVIVGPTPPPYHGMAIFTRMLVTSPELRRAYAVIHLDTADRRSMDNMGRLDARNVALALAHAGRLAALIARHRPQVVYIEVSQNALAYLRDAVLMAVARLMGRRVVTHLHGSDFRAFYGRSNALVRWMVRWTSRWVSCAGVLGEGLRDLYAGLVPAERVRVAPPGIRAAAVARPAARREGPVTITYLGMLYRPKGILELLQSAAILRGRCHDVRFEFAGEWYSEGDRLAAEALVAERGLGERVRFVGVVDGAAKAELLERTDVLVFPGHQPEGLPLVVLEAMAAGIPVVATPVGAIPDAVRDGVEGVIVPARDAAALAGALARLAADPALRERMGRAARQRFLEAFTEERSVQHVIELLDAARA